MCYSGQCSHETYFGTCNSMPNDCPNITKDKTVLSAEDKKKLKEILLPMIKCSKCPFDEVCELLVDNNKKDICQLLNDMEG